MSNPYSQTIDHVLVALSEVKTDVEKIIDDLIRQNQELVDENRWLKQRLEDMDSYMERLDG